MTDLDNTLLRSDKTISAYTAEVLANLRRQGVKVACATARPPRAVAGFGLAAHFQAAVYAGGALVRDGGHTVARFGFGRAEAEAALAAVLARQPQLRVSAESDDTLYANFNAAELWPGFAYRATDFAAFPVETADKLILHPMAPQTRAALQAALAPGLYLHTDLEGLTYVMHRDATKLKGVGALLARWGIPLEDTAYFGDDAADAELLAACGHGVAVAGAVPEAKRAARHTCGHPDEDGVARWLAANAGAAAG